jgi:hypothetical protein
MALDCMSTHGNGSLGMDHAEHGDMLVQIRPMYANTVAEELTADPFPGRGFSEDWEESEWRSVAGTVVENYNEFTIGDPHRLSSEVLGSTHSMSHSRICASVQQSCE